ncbi:MAG TPA: hypothetical protein G4O12_06230 [Dehalococcoidia bacterium]|nr:hypothetical protein [Dehalococcoidia bacterium]
MIRQVQKPIEEILQFLDGKQKIVLMGCGGYTTVFHTGGDPEVKKMAETLFKHGKDILAAITVPFGEFTCYAPWNKERLKPYRRQIEECDAMLMMTCGIECNDGLLNVIDSKRAGYPL